MDMSDKMREQINKERSAGIAAIERQKAEIERLRGIIAMQADALRHVTTLIPRAAKGMIFTSEFACVDDAITASSETVSSYLNEVRAKALEDSRKEIASLRNLLVCMTHHDGALEEYKPRWLPIVQTELSNSMASKLRTNKGVE